MDLLSNWCSLMFDAQRGSDAPGALTLGIGIARSAVLAGTATTARRWACILADPPHGTCAVAAMAPQ